MHARPLPPPLSLAACVLLAAACVSPQDREEDRPFTAEERTAYFSRARDPRHFALTTYRSDLGPVFRGAFRLHSGQLATLPMSSKSTGAAVVEFLSRGDERYLGLIDTTAAHSWITPAAAARMGVVPFKDPVHELPPRQVEDTVGGAAGLAAKLRFDVIHMENAILYTRLARGGLGPLARGREDDGFDAVLGNDFLSAFSYLSFDFGARSVTFSTSARYTPPADRLLASLPLEAVEGALAVPGIVGGENVKVILDTAGDHDLVMPDPEVERVGQVILGDLVRVGVPCDRSLPVSVPMQPYPRIGWKFLERYRVTLDFSRKQAHFERPASADGP